VGISPKTIAHSLASHPDVKAIILVNPTYHGITSDVPRIAEIVHAHNIPLLVDEAHGPHLHFHEDLPRTALENDADAVVQGTHKMLSAFTQASMLHIQGRLINQPRLEACLRLLQSTSTSYLLLASLDAARAQMATRGRELLQYALDQADYLRQEIKAIPGFSVLGQEMVGSHGICGLDPTKITISVRALGITGLWAERWLREQQHIQVEMSDVFNLLLIVGFGNSHQDATYFLRALKAMSDYVVQNQIRANRAIREANITPGIPELVVPPRDAFVAQVATLPLEEAVGRISTEVVACYPPGIPILCPGEKVTGEIVAYLTMKRKLGAHFQGCSDPNIYTLRVIK